MKYLDRAMIIFLLGMAVTIHIPAASADVAIEALNANQLDKARMLFLQRLPNTEIKNTTLTRLGEVEFHAGNYDKSIDYLHQAIEIDPKSAISYLLLGNAYGRKAITVSMFSAFSLAKKCIESFEKAYTLDAKNSEILQALVEYHIAAPSIVGGSKEKLSKYLVELQMVSPEMARFYEINDLEKNKNHDKAIKLALDLKQQQHLAVKTQFLLAHYFKENKYYSEAEDMLENLIKTPMTTQTTIIDRWYISDASLQLGEVFLETKQQLDRAVILVKDFQEKNNNSKHSHYYWSFLSLAKIYKANGDLDKYQSQMDHIRTLDYKQDKYFAKVFEKESKS
jgi:tetratricopeptide (TPR) repeat protein